VPLQVKITGRVAALVLGIPGSGKSTLCEEIARQLNAGWLSASSVLRAFGAKHPELEKRWRPYWIRGEYVPESETSPVLWQAYVQMTTTVVLLDGYPRTYGQVAEFLQRGGQISVTLHLLVDESLALLRIVDRLQQLGRFDDSADVARRRIQREIVNLSMLVTHREINRTLVEVDASLNKTQVADGVIKVITEMYRSGR